MTLASGVAAVVALTGAHALWRSVGRPGPARRRAGDLIGVGRRRTPLVTTVSMAVARLGAATRRHGDVTDAVRRAGRTRPLDDRARGTVLLAVVLVAIVVNPMVATLAVAVAVGPPALDRRRARRRRSATVIDELPEVVELLHLAVSAGLNLHLAIEVVVAHSSGPCTEVLATVLSQVERGHRLVDALDQLEELGLPARPLHDALVGAERHGTPVLDPLARVADDVRTSRRQRRDERARRLPVALLFPLVCCTLPALALVTVVPVVARPWTGGSP
jgi:tight adherence protein C